MVDLGRVFQLTFADLESERTNGSPAADDAAALVTYRYLRLAMVTMVVALGAAILEQRGRDHGWQNSISAYYYTPARPIFVAGMVGIGLGLIVIKGRTPIEDWLLNCAGMLAPIVGLVPTDPTETCTTTACNIARAKLIAGTKVQAHDNLKAVLIAGSAAVAFAAVVLAITQLDHKSRERTQHQVSRIALLVATLAAVLVGWSLLASGRILKWHAVAAVWMFVMLGLASLWSGITLWWFNHKAERPAGHWRLFAGCYVAIAAAMVIAGIIIKTRSEPWRCRILVLEIIEIGLFAAMWIVQSVERWGTVITIDQGLPAAGADG